MAGVGVVESEGNHAANQPTGGLHPLVVNGSVRINWDFIPLMRTQPLTSSQKSGRQSSSAFSLAGDPTLLHDCTNSFLVLSLIFLV